MVKPTIIFRADGGPSVGMGHFTRTLALAEMLNKHFHCIFATRQPTENQITEIEKICHDRIDLPADNTHFEQFLTKLGGHEIVVLDNYYFTTKYQKVIKAKGCKLACIDDLHDKHFVADVVINHAEGISLHNYSFEEYTKLLLGYRYALIRKEFRNTESEAPDKKYTCMVMMGGADPLNITKQIVGTLAKVKFNKPIVVINGKSQTENHGAENARSFIYLQNQTANQIAGLMRNTAFGFFPASTVAMEACAVRLPFICGYFVENQMDIYHGIEINNLAVCVGDLNKFQETQIRKAIKTICLKGCSEFIKKQQTELMDNKSEQRLLRIFQEL